MGRGGNDLSRGTNGTSIEGRKKKKNNEKTEEKIQHKEVARGEMIRDKKEWND